MVEEDDEQRYRAEEYEEEVDDVVGALPELLAKSELVECRLLR